VRRCSTLVAVATALALSFSACSGTGDGPEPAAESLAEALSAGDLDGVQFTSVANEQAQQRWEALVAGMGDTPHEVTLAGSDEDGQDGEDGGDADDSAVATLSHRWELGSAVWEYQTTAGLTRADDAWTVSFDPSLVEPSLEDGEVLRLSSLSAPRGEIMGSGGEPLVTERAVLRFGIDKTQLEGASPADSAEELAGLLEIEVDGFVDQVEAAGDEAFVEALVLRVDDVPSEVNAEYEEIPGAAAVSDEIPLAPTREFAGPILGTVGPVTAELIEESDGAYEPGDEVGLSGLQQRHEETLAGQPGAVVQAGSEAGDDSRELFRAEPVAGDPLPTTLDLDLQAQAEEILAEVEPASALVAVRPSDGYVLAAASGPGSQGYATATAGQYPPGSTFKVVTSLALLRAGHTPQTVMPCTETVTADGKAFENYDDYPADGLGEIDLHTALANSCNTAFIQDRDTVTQPEIAEAAAALGLGVEQDLGFPAYLGAVPDEASETEHAAAMIGQGQVLASPLAMATVAASITHGETVVPTLLPDANDGTTAPAEPLTSDEAATLREMMTAVVDEGSANFLADVPGDPVLAKTGTAEYGTEPPLPTHAWMIAAQGDLAVSVFVEQGESGSQTAGPLLEEFLDAAQ